MADDDDEEIAGLPPGYRAHQSVLDPYSEKDLSLTDLPHRESPFSERNILEPHKDPDEDGDTLPAKQDKKGRDIVSVPGVDPAQRTQMYPETRFGPSIEPTSKAEIQQRFGYGAMGAEHTGEDETADKPDDDNPVVRAQRYRDQTQQKYAAIENRLERELARLEAGTTTRPPQISAIDYQGYMQRYDQQQRQDFKNKTLTFLAIAVPLALAFGISGRGSIWQALGALGEGMTALVKGHDEQRKEKFKEFADYANYARDLNNDKIRQYEEVLRDQRSTSAEKVRLLSTLAHLYGDETAAKHTSVDQWLRNINDKKILNGRYSKVLQKTLKTVDPVKEREAQEAEVLGHKPTADDKWYQTVIKSRYGFDPFESVEAYQRAITLVSPEKVAQEKAKTKAKGGAQGRDEAQKESEGGEENQNPDNLNLPGSSPTPSPTPSVGDAANTLGVQ